MSEHGFLQPNPALFQLENRFFSLFYFLSLSFFFVITVFKYQVNLINMAQLSPDQLNAQRSSQKKGSHELQAKFPHRKPPWDSPCRAEQSSTLNKVTNKIVDFVNMFYVITEMQCLAIMVYRHWWSYSSVVLCFDSVAYYTKCTTSKNWSRSFWLSCGFCGQVSSPTVLHVLSRPSLVIKLPEMKG